MCRKNNHSQFHWNLTKSPESLIPPWMYCRKSASMIIGTSMEQENCQIHEEFSQDLRYCTKLLQKDTCALGGDWQKFKRHHVQITHGLTLGGELEKPLKEARSKNGLSKRQNSNMPEIWWDLILLIQAMKITKTSLRMQGESWRHQRLRQYHVKESSKASIQKNVLPGTEKAKASDAKTRFSCIAEAHESTRQRIEFMTKTIHDGHIAGKEQNSIAYNNLFPSQFPPREGPKVTLRKRRVHKSSNALRLPRETVVTLQKWDSNPFRTESCIWPDEECEQFLFKFVHEFVPK